MEKDPMRDYPEISLGAHRNNEGEPLVHIDGVLCGTVENLKRSVDGYWNDEIQRKLAEAGVRFSMADGVPKISVPASAAHLINLEGCAQASVRLYDPREDPIFAYAVTEAVNRNLRRRIF